MLSLVKIIKERGTSRQVKIIFVVATTSATYSDKIIIFVLCLFDTRRGFLVHKYIPEFKTMNHEDLLDFQHHEEDENMTNRRKINKINKRTGIKNLMRQIFGAIHTSRSGISHNSPIKIDGEGGITYKVFRYYMALKINVSYVETDSAEEHLREIRSNKIVTTDMVNSNRKVRCMVHQSSSRYGGIRSAMNHVYILARVQLPEITYKRAINIYCGNG